MKLWCMFLYQDSTLQCRSWQKHWDLHFPGTALMPSTSPDLLAFAKAGRQAVRIAQMENMRPSDIVTMDSFENAILVHAAISGSTNCLLHLPAIAHEFALRSQETPSTNFTEMQDIFWMFRPAGPPSCRMLLLCRWCTGNHGKIKEHLIWML